MQRPRFLAISEFGPGAFIYHEGARYEVNRVSLPARDDGTGVNITEIKRCNACGYLTTATGPTGHEPASTAAATSLETMTYDDAAAGGQDPPPRPDQRRRGGTPARRARDRHRDPVRAPRRAQPASSPASCITVDGTRARPTLTYGDTALIRRMNVGLRRRKDKDRTGYLLDTVEGRWASDADLTKNVPPGRRNRGSGGSCPTSRTTATPC